jgi:hypothetical protein
VYESRKIYLVLHVGCEKKKTKAFRALAGKSVKKVTA